MTLFAAYLALGAALLAIGAALLSRAAPVLDALGALPRSLLAAVVFFGGATAWFIHGIYALGEADLAGFPRIYLAGFFAVVAVLALFFLRDLLAVRGIAGVMLLAARALLDAGFTHLPHSFLLAATAYLLVVFGLLWGVAPRFFRDWLEWTLDSPRRTLAVGAAFAALGAANTVAAFLSPDTSLPA
ncbi:MAG: hypothetical protein LBR07_01825 [Puniceicoccales bacterium]|jgi:hypothetical protein|nr:hypothetical protein [Puniceicoccales bacterium]